MKPRNLLDRTPRNVVSVGTMRTLIASLAFLCGLTVRAAEFAAVTVDGHSYLIAATSAPQPQAPLIAKDERFGLALYAADQGEALDEMWGYGEVTVNGQPANIATMSSRRHTFGEHVLMGEVRVASNLRDAGSVLRARSGIAGILSDETVVLMPAQSAKAFRARDLPLLETKIFNFYRLAFPAKFLKSWVARVTSPDWRPELTLQTPTVYGGGIATTHWLIDGSTPALETCYGATARAAGDENYPVGGVEPHGVGGLEDVLSSCRVDVDGHRAQLAYRRAGTFEIQSVLNVQSYLDLRERAGWSVLLEAAPVDAGQGAELVAKAAALKKAAIKFYRQQGGNPLILRRVFLLASLLSGKDWAKVTAADLTALKTQVFDDIPLDLGSDDPRVAVDVTGFAVAKTKLVDQIAAVAQLRAALP